ncbi:MAG: DNA alkylation repair protein [Anaerolineae bacterium]|nr:MAG: DNA alkylation repair protein [Anaerolineae bacterium]
MTTAADAVLEQLRDKGSARNVEGMGKFGMATDQRLGVPVPEMRKIAKGIGKDHELALELWKTGVQEARIVASMIDVPEQVSEDQMEAWVVDFDSWDVCDQVCLNLFEKTAFSQQKIDEWSVREEEFVKRAAYALIAGLAWHDKKAADDRFIGYFPVIKHGATDERNFVKKAVNWALRNIGKRNSVLNAAAIKTANEIQQMDSKSARWIASDAIRELESEKVQAKLAK